MYVVAMKGNWSELSGDTQGMEYRLRWGGPWVYKKWQRQKWSDTMHEVRFFWGVRLGSLRLEVSRTYRYWKNTEDRPPRELASDGGWML